jgi:hypothetical protein
MHIVAARKKLTGRGIGSSLQESDKKKKSWSRTSDDDAKCMDPQQRANSGSKYIGFQVRVQAGQLGVLVFVCHFYVVSLSCKTAAARVFHL